MFKGKLSVMVVGCLLASLANAQDFSFQPVKPKKDPGITQPVIPKVDVLTPDEFKSQVKTLNQQNQDELSKLVEKMLPPKQPGAQPGAAKAPDMPVTNNTFENSTPPAARPAAPVPAEPNPAATGYAPAFPNEPANGAYATPAPAPSSSTSSQPSQQRQGYTGFGTGSGSTGAGTGSQSSGGWNIKY